MPSNDLPPDPESVEKWQKLPQNQPSKDALPPVVMPTRWLWWFMILIAVLVVVGLLLQRGTG